MTTYSRGSEQIYIDARKKFKEELHWVILRANSKRLAGLKTWVHNSS
jgi:hypothetical protein